MDSPRAIETRRYDDGVDFWETVTTLAAPALRGAVSGYGAYREDTRSFTARRELAATRGVLIICLGEPLEIVGADGGVLRLAAGEAFAGGLADATSVSRALGRQAGIHVDAPLETLGRLLGCPPAAIANRVIRLDDALGGTAHRLGDQMLSARDMAARFDLLDSFVGQRLATSSAPDPRIAAAGRALRRRPGLRIDRLAADLNVDRRMLARQFRQQMGFGPRRYAALARFEAFTSALSARPAAGLADLAQEAGYYDQPHLNRDVRRFAAMTPAELAGHVLPGGGGIRME